MTAAIEYTAGEGSSTFTPDVMIAGRTQAKMNKKIIKNNKIKKIKKKKKKKKLEHHDSQYCVLQMY